MRPTLSAIALLTLVFPTFADAPAKRPMTAKDLWAVKRVGPPSTAPDGKWCVVEVTTYDIEKDDSRSDLWLLATDGSAQKQLTHGPGKNSGPVWSPDGQHIAFTTKRGNDDGNQIYVIPPSGGEARRVSNMPTAPSALEWSADSKTVYCIGWTWPDAATDADHRAKEKTLKDTKAKAVVIDDAQFRYWDHWISDGKRPYVFAVDVASGKHRNLLAKVGKHLPPYEPSAGDYDVSPDGKELAFVSENVKEVGLDANHDIYALALDKPDAKPVNLTTDNAANDTNPVYSSDGSHLAFVRTSIKYFYADKASLMVRSREGELRNLTTDLDYTASSPRWMPDSKRIAFESDVRGYLRIGFANMDKPPFIDQDSPLSERSISPARDIRLATYIETGFGVPPRAMSHGPSRKPAILDHFNDALVDQWKLGKVENKTFKGAGGQDVQMWIIYPPDFDPAKKWPLVQVVHGGPHGAVHNDFSFRWNPHLWAAQGWVIACVNFHGSSGFGQRFCDSITGDLGEKPMTDIQAATDWFEKQPWIDKNRIAAAGGSYGGYMMAWLNGHTDRFKAHVCHAGVYNWHSMVASDFVKGRERSLGAPPWGDLDRIDRQNAQRFAANFKTPTLVVHGEKDYRVPITQGLEYYNTLRQKGVPTRLLYFPDENHWVLKPANSLVWHREVFGWLDKYIGHGPSKE